MDSELGYGFEHYAMTCQLGVGNQYLLYTSILLFYFVIVNLLVLSCFAIIVACISLSRLILIRNGSLFICIIPNVTSCLYVYFSIINGDALFQNNSCNDVGHDHHNKLCNDDEVFNYYVLPLFNYLSLSVYKLFYMQYNPIVFFTKFSNNSRLCKLHLSFCTIPVHCNILVDIYNLFLKTITTLEIKFVFSGIYTHIINYSKLYNIPSVLITLISSIMTMHVLIIINTAYHTCIVTIHFHSDMTYILMTRTCMRSYMHTYIVTCCDNHCEVINLHVHVCVVLTLFNVVNSEAVGIILLCFIKFYICTYSSQLYNFLLYVIILVIVNYLESIHLLLMIKLFYNILLMAAVCMYIYYGHFGLCICLSLHNHYFALHHMGLSGRWRNRFTSTCKLCYSIIPAITVLSYNFNNLKTECQYNSLTFCNYSIYMFNTCILFISCNSYSIFINIPFSKSIFIIQSSPIEVLINFTARMNSNRVFWSINVNHATALMVLITWRYNYPFSIILLLTAYYYTHCKNIRCPILVSVAIYRVWTVLFDITHLLLIHEITIRYSRLFTWTVYVTLKCFKVMIQLFSIPYYQCNHKLYIQNPPYCSQLIKYGNPNIHKILLKIIYFLILYNTYIVRMCIHNVTVVLILMHIWKSTLHNFYHSYFLNLKFVDPLNTNHYRWQYLRNKSSYEVTVLPVNTQSSYTPNSNLPLHNNANDSANLNIDGELTDHRIDYSALGNTDPDTHYLSANKPISHYYTENEFNNIPNLKNKLTYFNTNIRSIPKNFDTLKYFLFELNHNFSIISISETWLKQYNKDNYNLKGYSHISKIRPKKSGGGTSIFVRSDINFKIKENISVDLPGVDSIAIEIHKDELNSTKNVIILALYRPPNINAAHFIIKLTDTMQTLHEQNKHVFLMGDFNIDITEAMLTTNRIVNDFHNLFLSYHFYNLINKPTRVTENKSSIIDNIYTNVSKTLVNGIFKTDFSDHYSIFCVTDLTKPLAKNKTVIKREFNANNIRKFNETLNQTDWGPVYNLEDFNESYSYFQKKFDHALNLHFPSKTVEIKYNNRVPYITRGIRQSIKQKHKLYDTYLKNPTDLNMANYKIHRNKLTSLLRITERTFHEEQLEINVNDSTKCWKIIKEAVGQNSVINDDNCTFHINGNDVNDKQIISDEFNEYFVNIGPKLASNIDNTSNPIEYVNDILNSISIPTITESEVTDILLSLKNSSAGYDEIPAHILIQNTILYIKPLTHLVNSSINKGIFPDELKIAKVIPIFKSGNKESIENYRPISILSVFTKVFEKVMYKHLINFVDKNDILYKYQFGFRRQHSTNHAVITLVEKITNALDKGKVVVGCFLDLKKAFDTVNHRILISKLRKYGIRGHILQWFESYLKNRKQFVQIKNFKSQIKSPTCGVPQGSILGPLLFILYINDLANVSDVLFPILFADDTSVYIEADKESDLIKTLNEELAKLNIWLNANKLTINIAKSHYMVFHRGRRKSNICNPILNNVSLERVQCTKFLGIIIDDGLKWTNHISYIKNKIAKGFGIILRARKFFNKKTLLNLYHAFIFPYLIYCVEIWGNAANIYLDPLIKLQKKIIRVITFSQYLAHTNDLFVQLQILPFKKLVIHRIGLQMFKINLGYIPKAVESLFTTNSDTHKYNTRNRDKMRSAYGKHEFMYSNFRFVGIHIWNYILDHLDINVTLPRFKKTFKTHILADNFTYHIL